MLADSVCAGGRSALRFFVIKFNQFIYADSGNFSSLYFATGTSVFLAPSSRRSKSPRSARNFTSECTFLKSRFSKRLKSAMDLGLVIMIAAKISSLVGEKIFPKIAKLGTDIISSLTRVLVRPLRAFFQRLLVSSTLSTMILTVFNFIA